MLLLAGMARLQPPDRLVTPGACPLAVGRSATEYVSKPGAPRLGLTRQPLSAHPAAVDGHRHLLRRHELGVEDGPGVRVGPVAGGLLQPVLVQRGQEVEDLVEAGPAGLPLTGLLVVQAAVGAEEQDLEATERRRLAQRGAGVDPQRDDPRLLGLDGLGRGEDRVQGGGLPIGGQTGLDQQRLVEVDLLDVGLGHHGVRGAVVLRHLLEGRVQGFPLAEVLQLRHRRQVTGRGVGLHQERVLVHDVRAGG